MPTLTKIDAGLLSPKSQSAPVSRLPPVWMPYFPCQRLLSIASAGCSSLLLPAKMPP